MKHKRWKTRNRFLALLLTAAMLVTAPDISALAEAATSETEQSETWNAAAAGTEETEETIPAEEAAVDETEEIQPETAGTEEYESETSGTEESSEDIKVPDEEKPEASEAPALETGTEEETEASEPSETEDMETEFAENETEKKSVELEEDSGIKAVPASPANPVYHCTKQDDGTDYTDWSYVYFGSYPQSEVTGDALTSAITGAAYDSNGDAWVNGTKYRRISKSDTNNTDYFGSSTYRYFKWERIKWRVLQNDGNTLFVVADQGLDCKDYNEEYKSITWENCTLRQWLNSDFYGTAFSSAEQGAVVEQTVVNEDNPYYNTEGGNNTNDKVYLLSIGEVTNPSYGFCESGSTCSASRWMQTSDFAHARGAYTYSNSSTGGNANSWWWLRSPGNNTNIVANVNNYGYVGSYGDLVYNNFDAVVPALHINLSSDLWSLSDDGTTGNTPGSTTVKATKIKISAPSKKIAAGKKVQLTVKVTPKNVTNKKVTWKSGNKKYATVNSKGVVTTKKAGKGKTVTITATARDGSGVKASIKIQIMKNAVTKVKIKNAPKTLKAGRSVTLKTSVSTNGKSANKTLKWTSSNSKYATVNSKGKVTAKKAGKGKTVTITAASTDGTNKNAKVKIKIK